MVAKLLGHLMLPSLLPPDIDQFCLIHYCVRLYDIVSHDSNAPPHWSISGGTVVGLLRNGLKKQAALQDRLCRPTVLTRRQPVKLVGNWRDLPDPRVTYPHPARIPHVDPHSSWVF